MSERQIEITFVKHHDGTGPKARYGFRIQGWDGWINGFGRAFPKGLILKDEVGPPKGRYEAEIKRVEKGGNVYFNLEKATPLFSWDSEDNLFAPAKKPDVPIGEVVVFTGSKRGTVTAEFKHDQLTHLMELWIDELLSIYQNFNFEQIEGFIVETAQKLAVSEWIERCRSGQFADPEPEMQSDDIPMPDDEPPIITDDDIPFAWIFVLISVGAVLTQTVTSYS